MTKWMMAAFALVAATAFVTADVAEAKRLGGGRSLGAQRQMTPPPAATVPKAAPSAPAQAAPATPAPAPAAAGASRWLGPLAGLAAGIGLAALLSHFGLSESFASFMLLALLVVGGFLLVRMLMARRGATTQPLQYAGNAPGRVEPRMEPAPPPAAARFQPVLGAAPASPATTPAAPAASDNFPPGFDPAPFVEQAKVQFRKMQAAYDTADLTALAEVMTPEMLAEVSRELAGRGAHLPTEVMRLDAEILGVATEGDRHWMSVRFTGLLREDGTVLPSEFEEAWNLTKPVDDSSGWMLAGIQQPHAVA
jgi:predicted lipid-binding transport protein (Tim44 family)